MTMISIVEHDMRYVSALSAAFMISGSAMLIAAPAFAGPDEAHQDSFWANQGVQGQSSAHGQYLQMDPRDAKAGAGGSSSVDQTDASNPYFNHAEGTMSGPAAVAQAPSNNGQYVATYHQYMKVDPRDQKVNKDTGRSPGDDIYYYHAEGTMGHP